MHRRGAPPAACRHRRRPRSRRGSLFKRGLPQDWFTTLKSRTLRRSRNYPKRGSRVAIARRPSSSAAVSGRALNFFTARQFSRHVERLQRAGWRDLYEGDIAANIVCRREKQMGGVARGRRFAQLQGARVAGNGSAWRGRTLQLAGRSPRRRPPPMCCGRWRTCAWAQAGCRWYVALARALKAAYAQRLTSLGEPSLSLRKLHPRTSPPAMPTAPWWR